MTSMEMMYPAQTYMQPGMQQNSRGQQVVYFMMPVRMPSGSNANGTWNGADGNLDNGSVSYAEGYWQPAQQQQGHEGNQPWNFQPSNGSSAPLPVIPAAAEEEVKHAADDKQVTSSWADPSAQPFTPVSVLAKQFNVEAKPFVPGAPAEAPAAQSRTKDADDKNSWAGKARRHKGAEDRQERHERQAAWKSGSSRAAAGKAKASDRAAAAAPDVTPPAPAMNSSEAFPAMCGSSRPAESGAKPQDTSEKEKETEPEDPNSWAARAKRVAALKKEAAAPVAKRMPATAARGPPPAAAEPQPLAPALAPVAATGAAPDVAPAVTAAPVVKEPEAEVESAVEASAADDDAREGARAAAEQAAADAAEALAAAEAVDAERLCAEEAASKAAKALAEVDGDLASSAMRSEADAQAEATKDKSKEEQEATTDQAAFPAIAWPTLGGPGKKKTRKAPVVAPVPAPAPAVPTVAAPAMRGAWGNQKGGGAKLIKEAQAARVREEARQVATAKAEEAKAAEKRSQHAWVEAHRLASLAAEVVAAAGNQGLRQQVEEVQARVQLLSAATVESEKAAEKKPEVEVVKAGTEAEVSTVEAATEAKEEAVAESQADSVEAETEVKTEDKAEETCAEDEQVVAAEVEAQTEVKTEDKAEETCAEDEQVVAAEVEAQTEVKTEDNAEEASDEDEQVVAADVASKETPAEVAAEPKGDEKSQEDAVTTEEEPESSTDVDAKTEDEKTEFEKSEEKSDEDRESETTEAIAEKPAADVVEVVQAAGDAMAVKEEPEEVQEERKVTDDEEEEKLGSPTKEEASEAMQESKEEAAEEQAEEDEDSDSSDSSSDAGGWSDDEWKHDKATTQKAKSARKPTAAAKKPAMPTAAKVEVQAPSEETPLSATEKSATSSVCPSSKKADSASVVGSLPPAAKPVPQSHTASERVWPKPGTDRFSAIMSFRCLAACTPDELLGVGLQHEERTEMPVQAADGQRSRRPGGDATPAERRRGGGRDRGDRREDRRRGQPADLERMDSTDSQSTWRGSASGTPASKSSSTGLTPSANAYRPGMSSSSAAGPKDRMSELSRQVRSHLNKIAPDNILRIAGLIVECKVASSEELELVIGLIMKKALTEPHYCETYADLVFKLKTDMPEFPSPDGGKPKSFKSTLLNVCQNEFEAMSQDALALTEEEMKDKEQEEIDFLLGAKKKRCLANMKFIGHLFLRSLLSARIIGDIMRDLAGCDDAASVPSQHIVECICELLNSIGYTLESMPAGQSSVQQVCGRLLDLKVKKNKKGKTVFPPRINFMIQDLLDTRQAGWTKKVFKAAAKTKDEIREDAMRDEKASKNDGSQMVVAGQRPAWMTDGKTSTLGPKSQAEDAAWKDVPTGKVRR